MRANEGRPERGSASTGDRRASRPPLCIMDAPDFTLVRPHRRTPSPYNVSIVQTGRNLPAHCKPPPPARFTDNKSCPPDAAYTGEFMFTVAMRVLPRPRRKPPPSWQREIRCSCRLFPIAIVGNPFASHFAKIFYRDPSSMGT